MKEDFYKLLLVSKLRSMSPQCLALETPFLFAKRRTDVLMLKGGFSHAFEIKSEVDNLTSLKVQVNDYCRVFDHVWVCVADKHLKVVQKILPRSIGIVVVKSAELAVKRTALQRKRLDKKALISSLDRKYLSRISAIPITNEIDLARIASGISLEKVREVFLSQLMTKYEPNYRLFQSEIGEVVLSEDLKNLGIERILKDRLTTINP